MAISLVKLYAVYNSPEAANRRIASRKVWLHVYVINLK